MAQRSESTPSWVRVSWRAPYHNCLAYDLAKVGLEVASQIALPLVYEEVKLEIGYRIDMLVADSVVVEIKSVETILPIHEAQLITYLKLSEKRWGYF